MASPWTTPMPGVRPLVHLCTILPVPPRHWNRSEVEATVRDYLDMLALELRGERFNKAARNRELRAQLDGRSHGAVERKHQNISAILISLGFPYIDGYKPLGHGQDMLQGVIHEQLPPLLGLVKADVEAPQQRVAIEEVLGIQVDPPDTGPPPIVGEEPARYEVGSSSSSATNYLQKEALNRSLGDAGEALVMEYERARLLEAGKDRLAQNVEQVSKTVGDHAGYDIRSYEVTGHDRFVEVKATRYGKLTPFYISAGEVRFSGSNLQAYHLYRLFNFRRNPKLFILPGDVTRHVRLHAVNYRAHF